MGSDSVHWRYGVRGRTRSRRWMAVSCARRALHHGHTPRDLQESTACVNGCLHAVDSATPLQRACPVGG
jgi:hypothetical protein